MSIARDAHAINRGSTFVRGSSVTLLSMISDLFLHINVLLTVLNLAKSAYYVLLLIVPRSSRSV